MGVKEMLEKALYIDPEKDRLRKQTGDLARQVGSRVAQVQVGMWYKQENPPPNQERTFSVEYESVFLRHSVANISIMYEHGLIRIQVSTILFEVKPQGSDVSHRSDRAGRNGGNQLFDSR
jgi:hypothetical protein